jgi:hypothetical protein
MTPTPSYKRKRQKYKTKGNVLTMKYEDLDHLLLFSPIPSPIFLFCECEEREIKNKK